MGIFKLNMGLQSGIGNIMRQVLLLDSIACDERSCRLVANQRPQDIFWVWAVLGLTVLCGCCTYVLSVVRNRRWGPRKSGDIQISQPVPQPAMNARPQSRMIGDLLYVDGMPAITDYYNVRSRTNSLDSGNNTDAEGDDNPAETLRKARRRRIARGGNFWGFSQYDIHLRVDEVYRSRLRAREVLGPDASVEKVELEYEITSEMQRLKDDLVHTLCQNGPKARPAPHKDVMYAYTGNEDRSQVHLWEGTKEPTPDELRDIINKQFKSAEEHAEYLWNIFGLPKRFLGGACICM